DGSTAVEVALKQALQLWHNEGRTEKRHFVALEGAFHGDTLGVTGLGGVDVFRAPFRSATPPVTHLPVPPADENAPGYAEAVTKLRELMERDGHSLAAVV